MGRERGEGWCKLVPVVHVPEKAKEQTERTPSQQCRLRWRHHDNEYREQNKKTEKAQPMQKNQRGYMDMCNI